VRGAFKYLKIFIVVSAYAWLGYKLVNFDFSSLEIKSPASLLFVFIFMFVNWAIEAYKWQLILRIIYRKTSYYEALKSVLWGLLAGVITPNRVGEYLGRTFMQADKDSKKKVFALSLFSSAVQSSVTALAGVIALIITGFSLSFNAKVWFLIMFAIIFTAGWILFKKSTTVTEVAANIKNAGLIKSVYVFLLSSARFVVFIIQAAFIFYAFGIEVPIFQVATAMSLMYFIVMFIPSVFFAEIGIRGSVALVVFPFCGINGKISAVVVSVLWLINIAVPVALSALFIKRRER